MEKRREVEGSKGSGRGVVSKGRGREMVREKGRKEEEEEGGKRGGRKK